MEIKNEKNSFFTMSKFVSYSQWQPQDYVIKIHLSWMNKKGCYFNELNDDFSSVFISAIGK